MKQGRRQPSAPISEMKAEKIPTVIYDGQWTAPATNCDENGQGELPSRCTCTASSCPKWPWRLASQAKTTVEKMTLVADIGRGQQPPGYRWPALRRHGPGHRTGPHRRLRGHPEAFDPQGRGRASRTCQGRYPTTWRLIYVETPRPEGPFGAAGVGELPLTCPHAAIINAIYDACGAFVSPQLPALPEKVLAGLQEIGYSQKRAASAAKARQGRVFPP